MTMPKLSHALLLTLSVTLLGCKGSETGTTATSSTSSGSATSSDAIPIGEYGSMTGKQSTFGQSTHEGIQLAIDEINGAGGLNGKQLQIVGPEDTASQAPNAATAVKRLMGSKVVAVLGEVASSGSMAAAPVCQENRVPMISPSSTNPKVTEIGDYIFRVCFIDPFQAAVVAKFAKDTLKANSAAVFYDAGQAYSVGFRDNFKSAFESKGGKIVVEASYSEDDKDYKAALTTIKAANPDVILVPGYYTQAGSIAKQARDMGITVPLLGGDGWDSAELFTYAGGSVGNCFFSDHMSADDPNPTVQNFVKAYQTKYSKVPDALAALGYDAAKLLYDAMKRAKSLDGPDLRDAIAQTKDFDGVTGKITINAQRNADKPAVMIEAASGKFKFKEKIANP